MTFLRKNQPIRLPALKPGVCSGLILSGAFSPDLKIGVWRRRTYQFGSIAFLILIIFFGSLIRGAWATMTTEEEKKLGKRIALEIEKKVEVVRDLTLQTFLNKIGNSLVAQVYPTPFEFKFYLVNSQDPNAFAIPGGYIFVTTGLLVLAENEQEIAAVLSHEISHVTQRHIAQLFERAKRLNFATIAAVLAAMIAGGGGQGSQAAAMTAMATAEALVLKYTREMEADADQNTLHYLIKAGYDPNAMITFLNKLLRMSLASSPKIPAYLSTHPAIEDRMALLDNLLKINPTPGGPFKVLPNFKKVQIKAFVEERASEMAVTHFQSWVDANPQSLDGYYGLGLAYRRMGRLDKSAEVFEKGLSLAPKDLDLWRELGVVYFLSGKLDQAIKNLDMIRSSSLTGSAQGSDFSALYYLGRAFQEKGDFANALPLFLEVKRENPEFMEVYLNLGSVYGRTGEKGLSHFNFGKHFKLRGEKKTALLHFKKALEGLEKGRPEREEAQREIRELSNEKSS